MFHYRWKRQEDIDQVALRLASEGNPDSPPEQHQKAAEMIKERMGSTSESGGRGFAVGSNDVTSPLIEASFQEDAAGGGGEGGSRGASCAPMDITDGADDAGKGRWREAAEGEDG